MRRAKKMQMLPLRGVLVFPYMVIHLDVGREKSVKSLEKSMLNDSKIMLVAQKNAKLDNPEVEDLYSMGTISKIKQMIKLPGGTMRVLVEGLQRAELNKIIFDDPYYEVTVFPVPDEVPQNPELTAMTRRLLDSFARYIKSSNKIPHEVLVAVSSIDEPGQLADVITSHLPLRVHQKQEILELKDYEARIEKISDFLSREIEIVEIERKIGSRVRKQMEKTQKEYYLREQMKAIQKELGDKDEKGAEADDYRKRIAEANLTEEVHEKALKELDRLEKMPVAAAEAVVIRNYLDWLLELPWLITTEDRKDLDIVQDILDEDHCGLEKVKERIVEFLAVRQLAEEIKGPILCLIGPPGVGKTSLAKSIARSMERKFVRISLGGVRDEAEIRGHRRTYIGALPGRIIQGMKKAKSCNPVFLLDEIDKMSTDFRGDPSSALLEVLDPEQNNSFSDHFIEIPYDLSKVMFITTANINFNIPQPLLDRMETINISGYTEEEKVNIAQKHLIPKQLKEHGLTEENLTISQGALRLIIREHTREAGVRNLERNISAICRKLARKVVKERGFSRKITIQNLEKYMGIPRYRYGTAEKENQVGVTTGMAWTEAGGDILSIEVTIMKGKGKMTLTGKLGDVMQESARAALSFIRSRAELLNLKKDFYEDIDIHIHIPEGAIPKDGPSAGIAMATALVSAITKTPVNKDFALTGEITLRGRVLPVGGIKEKVLAVHRVGIKNVIMPAENRRELSEIPDNIRKNINFHLVDQMDEVMDKVLVDLEKKELLPGGLIEQQKDSAASSLGVDNTVKH